MALVAFEEAATGEEIVEADEEHEERDADVEGRGLLEREGRGRGKDVGRHVALRQDSVAGVADRSLGFSGGRAGAAGYSGD
jgi:hypothetical protein